MNGYIGGIMDTSITADRSGTTTYTNYSDPLDKEITLIRTDGTLSGIKTSLFKDIFEVRSDSMRIAVLGDLHGHLTSAFDFLRKWKAYTNISIDIIVQVGDIGACDRQSTIDKTTRELAKKDQKVMGFLDYYYQSCEADGFLGESGYFRDIPLYFVDGNHDDIDLLAKRWDGYYPSLQYLCDGVPATLSKSSINVQLTGLGWHASKGAIRRTKANTCDILLTHSRIREGQPTFDFAEGIAHQYHFFGHSNGAYKLSSVELNSYGLDAVKPKKDGSYNPGCVGILEIRADGARKFYYLPIKIPTE